MKTKQDYIDYLNEVATSYNINTRSIGHGHGYRFGGGTCKYYSLSPKGEVRGCAIGRRIEDKKLCQRLDSSIWTGVSNPETYELLPADLKEFAVKFLSDLQSFHDDDENWDETGLSKKGNDEKNTILEWIENIID